MKGIEFAEVRDAIARAFNGDQFDMFLYERLDFDRPMHIDDGPFRVVVDKVLRQAVSEGWDPILIAEVAAARPVKQEVQDVYQKYAAALVDEGRRQTIDASRLQAIERFGLGPKIKIQKAGTAQTPVETPAGGGFERTIQQHLPFLDVGIWRQRMFQAECCVCRVEVGTGEMGTGFLVGPDVVLTNYHVLHAVINNESPAAQVRFRFDYQVQANGSELPGRLASLHPTDWNVDHSKYTDAEMQLRPDDSVPTTDELDYALVRLDRALGTEPLPNAPASSLPRGWLYVPTSPPAIVPHMPILILQHPNTEPLKLALDTDGVLKVNDNSTRVRYATNTEGGSSGSPCFDMKWNLVALHHYGDPAFNHPEYNQGVPISTIRDRLIRQAKAHVLGEMPAASGSN